MIHHSIGIVEHIFETDIDVLKEGVRQLLATTVYSASFVNDM